MSTSYQHISGALKYIIKQKSWLHIITTEAKLKWFSLAKCNRLCLIELGTQNWGTCLGNLSSKIEWHMQLTWSCDQKGRVAHAVPGGAHSYLATINIRKPNHWTRIKFDETRRFGFRMLTVPALPSLQGIRDLEFGSLQCQYSALCTYWPERVGRPTPFEPRSIDHEPEKKTFWNI
jgi:hypothetical protein